MTGHFERGRWVEDFVIFGFDDKPFKEQVSRVAKLLNLNPHAMGVSELCLVGIDGETYSFLDIIEGVLRRVR